jgi:hypothetical protein
MWRNSGDLVIPSQAEVKVRDGDVITFRFNV